MTFSRPAGTENDTVNVWKVIDALEGSRDAAQRMLEDDTLTDEQREWHKAEVETLRHAIAAVIGVAGWIASS